MRKFKNSSILLIILLIIAISIEGCSSNNPKVEEPLVIAEEKNTEGEIVKEKAPEEVEESAEEEAEEEAIDDEDSSDEEQIDETEKDQEEPAIEGEKSATDKEPEKQPEKVDSIEAPEKEEPVVEKKNAIKIQGNVGKESAFTLDELKTMTDIIFEDDFYSLNNFGTTAYTHFKGVNLWKLLEGKAQISANASRIKIIATDGYEVEFTVAQVKRQDYIDETNPDKAFPMIIAWEEKGQEYDSSDAPPYKLIVGQTEAGDINKPQWVSKIDRIIVE